MQITPFLLIVIIAILVGMLLVRRRQNNANDDDRADVGDGVVEDIDVYINSDQGETETHNQPKSDLHSSGIEMQNLPYVVSF